MLTTISTLPRPVRASPQHADRRTDARPQRFAIHGEYTGKNFEVNDELVQVWRSIIIGDDKSWVLFENGTCVILMEQEDDLASQAIELLKEWGPVHAGCSAGDFSTITLENDDGWVVTSHHNDILTYVAPDEVGDDASDVSVGLYGRSKRNQDAAALSVIHVEDKRNAA